MAPELIKFEASKRAPTMDSLEAEEQGSPMKKHKVDKDEERYNDSDKHVPQLDSEFEWDVDSHDGRQYESDPDDRKLFSDDEAYDEYRQRKREAFASKGFICEPLSGNYPYDDNDLEAIVDENVTLRELMRDLANLCVKKFNKEKGKTVELVDIVRVIETGGGTRKDYITFMARESPNGPLVEYQAKVATYAGDLKPPFPILCRPALNLDHLRSD